MKWIPAVFVSLAFLGISMGCAHKKDIKAEPVPQAASSSQKDKVMVEKGVSSHYVVRKGDSLWKIASKPEVLGDAFHWPLLYKQNRDQIEDPDLIEVRQDLNFGEAMTDKQIADAVKKAQETPAYVPHSEVRKSLAVKY